MYNENVWQSAIVHVGPTKCTRTFVKFHEVAHQIGPAQKLLLVGSSIHTQPEN